MSEFAEVQYDEFTGAPAPKSNVDETARRVLSERQGAYSRVFGDARKDDVRIIMEDLAQFGRGFESAFHADPGVERLLLGRQEMFLRIVEFSRLNLDELFFRYHERAAQNRR